MNTRVIDNIKNAVKFDFDTLLVEESPSYATGREKTTWTKAEVDTIRQTAFEKGYSEGLTSAETQNRKACTAAVEKLIVLCTKLMKKTVNDLDQLKADAVKTAHLTARKLAGTVLTQYPDVIIREMLEQCLKSLNREPYIILKIPARIEADFLPVIKESISQYGMEKQVRITADDTMSPTDCIVEWGDGALERKQKDIEDEITHIVENFVEAHTQNLPEHPANTGSPDPQITSAPEGPENV